MQEMVDITISCIIFYIFDKCDYGTTRIFVD